MDAPELEEFLSNNGDERLRVVYRSYATLHFVFVVDSSESELGILDLIQVGSIREISHAEYEPHYIFLGFCRSP